MPSYRRRPHDRLALMADERPPSSEPARRVLRFPRREAGAPAGPPVADLGKYERAGERDDYRHRMMVNAVAFAFVLVLIGAGYWLADALARMQRNQDCVLSGRRGCTPVEFSTER